MSGLLEANVEIRKMLPVQLRELHATQVFGKISQMY